MHILGVNYGSFANRGIVGTIKVGNSNKLAITSPKVVEYAKKHFGCDHVKGVMLEDGGGSGSRSSHWEKALLADEVMNPMVASPAKISQFSIKLLEDLRWYKENPAKLASQDYVFHKGSGCAMVGEGRCDGTSYDDEKIEKCMNNYKFAKDHSSQNFCGVENNVTYYCE